MTFPHKTLIFVLLFSYSISKMAKKYTQTVIPIVENAQFSQMTMGELKKYVTQYFVENLKDKQVRNENKNIVIFLPKSGLKHITNSTNTGYIRLKAITIMDKMIQYAEYTNFKEPDEDDGKNILGYLHFKSKVNIEAKTYTFRIVVRLITTGKFYYDHSVKL